MAEYPEDRAAWEELVSPGERLIWSAGFALWAGLGYFLIAPAIADSDNPLLLGGALTALHVFASYFVCAALYERRRDVDDFGARLGFPGYEVYLVLACAAVAPPIAVYSLWTIFPSRRAVSPPTFARRDSSPRRQSRAESTVARDKLIGLHERFSRYI